MLSSRPVVSVGIVFSHKVSWQIVTRRGYHRHLNGYALFSHILISESLFSKKEKKLIAIVALLSKEGKPSVSAVNIPVSSASHPHPVAEVLVRTADC